MRQAKLAKTLAILVVLVIPGIAGLKQEPAQRTVEKSDKKYPLDDTIDQIVDLIDTTLRALELTPSNKMPRATTASTSKIDPLTAVQLKQASGEVRRRLDDLMELSNDFVGRVIRMLDSERSTVRELADHGVIKFEDGIKRERELVDKSSDIQTQHAYNKLELINNAKGLLLWESVTTATSRTETPSKRPARKRKTTTDDRDRRQEMRQLLEAVKVTLQLRRDWVHGIADWRKN